MLCSCQYSSYGSSKHLSRAPGSESWPTMMLPSLGTRPFAPGGRVWTHAYTFELSPHCNSGVSNQIFVDCKWRHTNTRVYLQASVLLVPWYGKCAQTSQLTILVCSEILRYLIHTKFGYSSTVTSSYYINKRQSMVWRKLIINNKQKKLRQKLCWIHGWYTDHRPF